MVATGLALVTGASSGIGWELTKLLANDGFDVVAAALDETKQTDPRVRPVRVDLRNVDALEDLSRQTTAGGRPIDVLALNAGTGEAGRFVDTPLEGDMNVIDLNVSATVRLAKLALRDMAAQGSRQSSADVVDRRSHARLPPKGLSLINRVLPGSVKAAANRIAAAPFGPN